MPLMYNYLYVRGGRPCEARVAFSLHRQQIVGSSPGASLDATGRSLKGRFHEPTNHADEGENTADDQKK